MSGIGSEGLSVGGRDRGRETKKKKVREEKEKQAGLIPGDAQGEGEVDGGYYGRT